MSGFLLGSSLKMYLGQEATLDWVRAIDGIARTHAAVSSGQASVFLLPGFTAIAPALEAVAGGPVQIGAQNLFWEDEGAFTGEVSGAHLAALGCTHAELGHAERRRILGETDAVVAAKTLAAFRNGLTPVLCVGESSREDAAAAGRECVRQLAASLADADAAGLLGPLVVAYEPQWAIGAAEPADASYVGAVTDSIRSFLEADPVLAGSPIIYGGSAGPGLLTRLAGSVDGLFLGRFGHDPEAFRTILDEVTVLSR